MDQKILDEIARQLQVLLEMFEKMHGVKVVVNACCCGNLGIIDPANEYDVTTVEGWEVGD